MHRGVMQNKKYIKFSSENTVEVISMSQVQKGVDNGDRKAATYTAKDKDGNKVEYLVEFPGLTVEAMKSLNGSKAASYNKTGKIPYTAIVNPHTLEEMQAWSGGQSAKTLMEALKSHKKELNKTHGPSVSRKVLRKLEKDEAKIMKVLASGKVPAAVTQYQQLARKMKKYPDAIQKKVAGIFDEILKAASRTLSEAERLLEKGEKKKALRLLNGFARSLRDTPLAEKVNDLIAKAES